MRDNIIFFAIVAVGLFFGIRWLIKNKARVAADAKAKAAELEARAEKVLGRS